MYNADITFIRSDNVRYYMGSGTKIGILSVEGMGVPISNLSTSPKAFGNGEIFHGISYSGRQLIIEGRYIETNVKDDREEISRFFNANYDYKIIVNHLNKKIYNIFKCVEFIIPNSNLYEDFSILATFKSMDSVWLSVDDWGKNINEEINELYFDFYDFGTGNAPTTYQFKKETNIENLGDENTYITAYFSFDEMVKNPTIYKKTGETLQQITILGDFTIGDIIKIDFDTKNVYINDIISNNKIKYNSMFFEITKGENIVGFSADFGDNNINVFVYYNQRFLGV